MKNFIISAGLLLVVILSCQKEPAASHSSMLMAGMKGSKGSEIVCVNIDSNAVIRKTPVESYVLSSTVLDPRTNAYGYMNADTVFILTSPETGKVIKSFRLPGYLSLAVVDSAENTLIGIYTVVTYGPSKAQTKSVRTGAPVYTNHLIRVSIPEGNILSDNVVDLGEGVYISTYYYLQDERKYVLYGADGNLLFFNPSSGELLQKVYLGKILNNSVYIKDKNLLVSLDYSAAEQKNYITVIEPSSGSVLGRNAADAQDGFVSNISGYDPETDCYITVNSNYMVLFYDISTGSVTRTYKLENPMNDIKFWRR
ncbi:MAG TPA: hypothetical protein VMT63_07820 [Bacteroidales bacterium]|nr:hypothetical protein [Bacteroidales bacterium]